MDEDGFRAAATAAVEKIISYRASLETNPVVAAVEPGYLRPLLPAAAPEHGESWAAIEKDLRGAVEPGLTHWQSPNFFAFFPCPASYASVLGELYCAGYGGTAFNWICSPAVTELETIVLDWLAQLLGLPTVFTSTGPSGGGGIIHGTASEAVLTAMTAAADKYLRAVLPDAATLSPEEAEDQRALRRARLVAFGSGSTHSSTKKAAQVLGLRYRAVAVSAADGFRMTGPALAATLAACRAAGLEPFFLTTTLGTTDTCAVDDFAGVADALDADRAAAAGREEVWVHVDAAYAGAALALPEQREPACGPDGTAVLARFHSFNTNMHKWMLTNNDCSCFFVRDRRWLVAALGADAHYYHNAYSASGLVTDYRDWQIPLGRRFRSLKVWFVLRAYGTDGIRAYLRRGIALGERFAAALRRRPDLFVLVAGPRFALTVFRCADNAAADPTVTAATAAAAATASETANARTRRLTEAINASGKIWVTGTTLAGLGAAIRVMTGNDATKEAHVDAAAELIIGLAEKLLQDEKAAPTAEAVASS